MKQKIYYDSDDYSGLWFWIFLICIVCCCFWWWPAPYSTGAWGWTTWGWIILGILFIWWICALCYAPMYVEADDNEVRIRRPLKTKKIRMDEIQSVEPYNPAGGKKTLKSTPVNAFGKWGKYHDEKIGDYFAYYGKPDNAVLITLKNGQKYVVGGSDAKAMTEYINGRLK